MKIKILIIAALFLIVAILFSISIKSELKIIYPQNSTHITDRTPTLMWQGRADELWLDKNPEFSSPEKIKLKARTYITDKLDTETYYWKLIGQGGNISGEFTIDGTAILEVERTESQLRIKNIGNVDLELSLENTINSLAKITGAMILEQGKTILLPNKNNTVVVAKEK
jgi:hypothetical protein